MSKTDYIEIVPYSPAWSSKAQTEIKALQQIFNHAHFPLIEHVGSTAVPNLDGKPVIDIVIACNDLEEARRCIPLMEKSGYVFWGDDKYPDHLLFIKGMPPLGAGRTHHVHIYPANDSQIKDHIIFRDRLRERPDLVKEYQDLKYQLAHQFRNDRDGYTEAKTAFVKKVLALL